MTGPELDPDAGATLVGLAVAALRAHLGGLDPVPDQPADPTLRRDGATFVTLEQRGALRGCVGTVTPAQPLWRDAVHNAVRAAADPRLPPVTAAEWPSLDVHVSVLSELEPVPAATVDVLTAALRPGVDGLLVSDGYRRATFLPAVWAKVPDPYAFVTALLVKGGWAGRRWPEGLTAQRYTVAEFHDRAPRPPLDGPPPGADGCA
jgi:AmmeMemoRadiSam system protein A